VTVIHAFFDESYGPDGLLCVAGFVFTKAGVRDLSRAWGHMLKRYDLPYFHMASCAHGADVFKNLGAPVRDQIAREAIRLIGKCAAFGVANTVMEPEFNAKVPEGHYIGNVRAYEFLVWNCLMGVRQYANEAHYNGKVAYFFEAGHKSQSTANKLMQQLFDAPNLRDEYRYAGHSFVPKESGAPIQAADLLAWQYYQDKRRELAGKPRRKDMQALLSNTMCVVRHINVDRHAEMVRKTMDEISSEIAAGQASS